MQLLLMYLQEIFTIIPHARYGLRHICVAHTGLSWFQRRKCDGSSNCFIFSSLTKPCMCCHS